MTSNSDNFDERLARLIAVVEAQAETARQPAENARQQAETARQQADNIKQQSDSIRSLAKAFAEQARAYREFSRNLPDMLETTRRAAQSSEGATFMAQRTLEAVRDLIEELRQERG
jgi:methyl-accepting chemotaxis protein